MDTVTEIIYDNIDFDSFPFNTWKEKTRTLMKGSTDLNISLENIGFEFCCEFEENTPALPEPFGAIFQTLSDSVDWGDIAKQVCIEFGIIQDFHEV